MDIPFLLELTHNEWEGTYLSDWVCAFSYIQVINDDRKVTDSVKIPWSVIMFFVLRLVFEGLSRECAIRAAVEEFGGLISEADILRRLG